MADTIDPLAGEDLSGNLFTRFSLDQLRQRTSEKWRCYGPDVLPLWVAEMDVPLAPAVGRELNRVIALGDTGYDSPEDGRRYAAAYQGFAKRQWGVDIDVSAARSTVDVISGIRALIVKVLGQRPRQTGLGQDQDQAAGGRGPRYQGTVIVQTPIYPPFLHRLPADYDLKASPLLSTGQHTDFQDLETVFAAVAAQRGSAAEPSEGAAPSSAYDAVFVLCSPHNPTGTVFPAAELAHIAQLCEQYHIFLIADEIHSPIVLSADSCEQADARAAGTESLGPSVFTPLLSLPQASRAVVAVSASKGFSLPGFKAALLVPGADAATRAVVNSLTSTDIHTGAHVASLVHAAAFEDGDAWLDQLRAGLAQNERIFRRALASLLPAARLVLGKGTYLAFLDLSAYVAGTVWQGQAAQGVLEQARVAFNPGSDFGGPVWGDWVRVNLATNPAIIVEALARVAEFVRSL